MVDSKSVAGRRSSILDTFKAVVSSFFGVRGRGAHERDLSRLNPVHLVIAGLITALLFVGFLLLIVRMIVK